MVKITTQAWDHKPKIKDSPKLKAVAVKRKRPNSETIFESFYHKYKGYDYFYDVWSNIHYGYIGLLVGFDKATLLGGADQAQKIDNSGNIEGDTPDDKLSIQIGFTLYEKFGENVEQLTAQDILDLLNKAQYIGVNNHQKDSSKLVHWCWSPIYDPNID